MSQDERRNPYEDADPIPVPRAIRTKRQEGTTAKDSARSRSVQAARDSASRQQRIEHLDEDASGVRPAVEGQHQPEATKTPEPQVVNQRATAPRQKRTERKPTPRGGYTPLAQTTTRQRSQEYLRQMSIQTRRKMGFGILVGIICAAIALLSFLLYYINRPVPIIVNGEEGQVRVSSTLAEVAHENHVSVTPGNYVSVAGDVLTPSAGWEFSVTVNGEAFSHEQIADYRIRGNEAIEFGDGEDIVEDFDLVAEPIMPYLKMDGSGYALQYISQWGRAGVVEHRVGKVSGASADVVTEEPQDCIVTCRDFYFEDAKYVALTFDDGPLSPYTEQYLDILARYGVKATFFFLGESVEANPELAARVVAEGHQVANHTMAHNQLTAVDAATIQNEITRSAAVIEGATGVATTHIRPPYGDFTERSWLGSGGTISAAIRWTGDSKDWELPGAAAIIENSLINVHSGTIILMHDGGGDRNQDVEALPGLIERLQAEGYQFLTISEMMRAAGDIPEDVCSGTARMPEGATWPLEIHPDDIAAAAAAS